jgi:hypothetical protein
MRTVWWAFEEKERRAMVKRCEDCRESRAAIWRSSEGIMVRIEVFWRRWRGRRQSPRKGKRSIRTCGDVGGGRTVLEE